MAEAQMVTTPAKPPGPALLAPLFFTDAAMELVAKQGRVLWPMLIAILCALALGGAEAYRVDAREATLREAEMSGQLKNMSDKQLEDNTKAAERKFIFFRVGWTAVKAPLTWLGSVVGLFALSWFLRGRNLKGAIPAVAAAALLPHALGDLIGAGAALLTQQLSPEHGPLVPRTLGAVLEAAGLSLGMAAGKLLSVVDFFSLWAALLLAFGLGPAANLPRRKAVVATLVAWLLWRLVTQVAFGG
jgi:Yip1 domain